MADVITINENIKLPKGITADLPPTELSLVIGTDQLAFRVKKELVNIGDVTASCAKEIKDLSVSVDKVYVYGKIDVIVGMDKISGTDYTDGRALGATTLVKDFGTVTIVKDIAEDAVGEKTIDGEPDKKYLFVELKQLSVTASTAEGYDLNISIDLYLTYNDKPTPPTP